LHEKSTLESENCSLECVDYTCSESSFCSVNCMNMYINCIPCTDVAENFNYELCMHRKWMRLKKARISNPEKDIVFKMWHGVGLSPKMAMAMGLYPSRDCPLCNEKDVGISHYFNCREVQILWTYILKILNKNKSSQPFDVLRFAGGGPSGNILIFYGYCTVYRCFIHKLNQHSGPFDLLGKYRQMVFGRLFSEYHSAKLVSPLLIQDFCNNWKMFKLFEIMDDKINIKLWWTMCCSK